MTTIQRLDALKVDLELQGLAVIQGQIEAIKTSHLADIKALQPKPKRVIAKKPKEQPLKVEITEAGKTTEVIFQTDKECDAFLKMKYKQRLTTAQNPTGLYPPSYDSYGINYAYNREEYNGKCAEYWQAAKEQNLDFTVIITIC